ncbi:hypothetical protein [Paenibacillus sp. J2TS4]|uniref:hypothetical protein n=1 Tax=Paenibacillus sp. J2TS4 TaxID=2807194 RepID=UPI001B115448|nr:hypothetical protein [Paenibacillus sp. J2TS4]GIP32434.1 hypothetical protein J2TS4_16440 [Paenibacillus sp. J2TS4]
MKLRVVPILLAVVCSSLILFGGWFMYRSYAMETPLNELVSQAQGVEQVQMELSNQAVNIKVKLNGEANLREIYQKVATEGANIIGKRQLTIQVENNSSSDLDQWWSLVLFDIAQAMDTRQYSQIPATLEEKTATLPGLQAVTEMDDNNVYVRLTHEGKSKYIILPRVPARLGVWPNEQVQ